MADDISRKAGTAGISLFFRKAWGGFLNLFVMAYLARVLSPEDFGLVAISNTLIGFMQVFGNAGIGDYLIYYKGEDESEIQNAAFWLNCLIALFIFIVLLFIAPFWASFYQDERITNLVWLLAIGFVFSTLRNVPNALLRKKLEYKSFIFYMSVMGTISQLSQAALAFWGLGIYSLVIPATFITPISWFILLKLSKIKPDFRQFGLRHWGSILQYTKYLFGSQIISKFTNDGDNLIIGKLLGIQALGIYDIAFKTANFFNKHLLPIVANISLPLFAMKKEEPGHVKTYYLKMISTIAVVFFPLYGGMAVFSADFINILYGANWESAILPFQILLSFAILRSLSSPTSGLLSALGKQKISFYFSLIFAPILLLSIYLGSGFGLITVCICVSIVRVLGSLTQLQLAKQVLQIEWKSIPESVPASFISALSAAALLGMIPSFPLPILASIYGLAFVLVMYIFFKKVLFDHLRMIVQFLPFKLPSGAK